MFFQAQRDFHLDLSRTFYIGDDVRDAEAADAAGCRFLSVDEQHSLRDRAAELIGQGVIKEKLSVGTKEKEICPNVC